MPVHPEEIGSIVMYCQNIARIGAGGQGEPIESIGLSQKNFFRRTFHLPVKCRSPGAQSDDTVGGTDVIAVLAVVDILIA